MLWTKNHDILLCREILVGEPYKFKCGSRERGHCWDTIANHLNSMREERFIVDQRSVRDRFTKLEKLHKRKMAEEEKASGISPEITEIDIVDIVEITREVQEHLAMENEEKENVAQKEKETAENVRKRSMERLAETKARENIKKSNKQKSSPLGYFREKHEKELDLKREEIELKKREMAIKEKEAEISLEIKAKEQERKTKEMELKKRDEEMCARNESSMIATLQ